ncbi:DUF1311 domain-containing protein [Sporosarcina sp. BI001-red]|uniref:lysozyme inhibitor LprI family protein n=1 Tax=Sporosarcina sp. BI001-red TaxID=2282866 RepID=UPI000E289BC3|nr:lysozyme inhibitor LprI family protein [Sporosarcina sp. BI001-red]REB08546.1 DUF1311 domain-containing protein [Sporosarcina sp. BI001-red]
MKRIVVVTFIVFFLTACSSGTYDKAMEQGKLGLADGNYDKALASFELAHDEKPKDQDAADYKKISEQLVDMTKLIEEEQWRQAEGKAQVLISQYELPTSLENKLKDIVAELKNKQSVILDMESRLQKIQEMADSGKVEEPANELDTLKQLPEWKDVATQFSEQLSRIEDSISTSERKRREIEAEKKRIEQEKNEQQAAAKKKEQLSANLQNHYLQKLYAIKDGLSDLDYLYKNGVTSEMMEATDETYTRWDNALNEIYSVLKKQLSDSEMESLRVKQRSWMKERDQEAEEAAAEFGEGTAGPLTYMSVMAQKTEERCYELVEQYMK